MAKPKKLTKKMLDILDKGELRKIAIISMGLVPGEAYSKDEKELLEWIYSKPEEFKTASLDEIDETFVRGGILTYVASLQAYLRGEITKSPTWPIDENAVEETPVVEVAKPEPTAKKVVRKKKPLKKRVEAKKAAAQTEAEKPLTPTDLGLVQEEPPVVPENVSTTSLSDLVELLDTRTEGFNTNLATVVRNILELSNKINMLRTEQSLNLAALSNAILYLLNTAVQDEGEEFTSLEDVPKAVENRSEEGSE